MPDSFSQTRMIGNLEGTIINWDTDKYVYNLSLEIEKVLNRFNIVGFTLANNHIGDTGKIDDTISFLKQNNISYTGLTNKNTKKST